MPNIRSAQESALDTFARLAGPVAIALVGGAMLIWTWATWPNALVDFGRELYAPWRLAAGDVLYRDVAYFNGPLSPYFNSLVFRIFGVSLRTLVVANLVLVVLLVGLLYYLIGRLADRLSATLCGLVFVTVFAFNQIDAIGNDNYLTPYSHETVHGLLLSLLGIASFSLHPQRPRLAALGSGLALGLVLLTKTEVFVALAAALSLGFACLWIRRSRVALASDLAFLAAGFALPPLASLALFSLVLPPGEAFVGTLAAWPALFNQELTSQRFYRLAMGTLDLAGSLRRLLVWSAGWAVFVSLAVGAGLAVAKRASPLGSGLVGLAVTVIAFAAGALAGVDWVESLRPLPIALLGLAAAAAVAFFRTRGNRQPADDEVLLLVLLVFALALLGKIALNVQLIQYGFVLAMPGCLLVIAALLYWIPQRVRARGGEDWIPRGAALGVILAASLSLLTISSVHVRERDAPVGSGRDGFLAGARGPAMAAAVSEVRKRLSAEQTLAVLPEGVMLNYLSRRRAPTRHINYMPPELIIFGEDQILADLRASPPDYVALTRKDVREYGYRAFGQDYGRELLAWALRSYRPVRLFGEPPLRRRRGSPNPGFGILLMERRQRPQDLAPEDRLE